MSARPHTAIRVISLSEALHRRQAFARSAGEAGCDWEFFNAHTTPMHGLSYDEKRVAGIYGRKLHPGELGCYSSHFDLWRWLVQADCEQLIVLEDDVVVDWEFIRDISAIAMASRGIEYLRLFAKMPAPWRIIASPYFDQYRHLIRFTGYPLGTQAYVLSKSGAERLLSHGSNIEAPVDVYMDRTWDHGLLNLAVYPFPVYERYQRSSIGEGRFSPSASWWGQSSLRNLWTRARRKLQLNWAIYGFSPSSARGLQRSLKPRKDD
jgi:glycosyl transferase, family 25